jgi:hypothetical protein
VAQLHRLYEQKKTSTDCDVILGEYVHRWKRWASAGINGREQLINAHRPNKTPRYGGVDNVKVLLMFHV